MMRGRTALGSRMMPNEETHLLQQPDIGVSAEMWSRYGRLVAKREDKTLTPAELKELKSLTNELEERNVRRIKALVRLAALRNKSLDALMNEPRIRPHSCNDGTRSK